jgi:hypothetical protein
VIVIAVKGTVMPMVRRCGEWIQVPLSPEMRKTGMVMRWYNNEGSGWAAMPSPRYRERTCLPDPLCQNAGVMQKGDCHDPRNRPHRAHRA